MSNFLKKALQTVASNYEQRKDGLILPPEYIAGKHFGGFSGYDPWIQGCVRAACESVRGVPKEEVSRLTAWCLWHPTNIEAIVRTHEETVRLIDQYCARVSRDVSRGTREEGLSVKAREQIVRVENGRGLGMLIVIAMNPTVAAAKGEVPQSVSAWEPASVEEAASVPKRKYQLEM